MILVQLRKRLLLQKEDQDQAINSACQQIDNFAALPIVENCRQLNSFQLESDAAQ